MIPEGGTMYLTTSSGYPYIYHNGVAYFHTPEVASVQQPWPVSNRFFFYICFTEVVNAEFPSVFYFQFLQLHLIFGI